MPSQPSPNTLPRAFRQVALAAHLRMFPDTWWLLRDCGGCGAIVHVPHEIVGRLRCRRCQAVPASVLLTDDAQANGLGGPPPTWRLPLLADAGG